MMLVSVSGSFFPRLLRHRITLRMALVRRQFVPAVAMQQVIDRRQGHLAPERGFQFPFDLRHYQNAAVTGAL